MHNEKSNKVDELLDLVDERDRIIGQEKRSVIYSRGDSNFRVVNVFVVNDEGKLWIPRRTEDKRIFPLHLDCSMGGHVEVGESYEDALKRELKEELGLDLATVSYREVGYFNPAEQGVSAFMKVYEIQHNGPINYNPKDFVEFYWLSPEELLNRIEKGDKGKGDLPKIVKLLYINHY